MRLTIWALALALFSLGPEGLHTEGAGSIALAVRGNRLTLWAVDTPLATVLQQLAGAAKITIYFDAPVYEQVNINLADVDLEAGIRSLLRHQNSIFLYTKASRVPSTIYVIGPREDIISPTSTQLTQSLAEVSEPIEGGEADVEAARLNHILRVEALEHTLRAASQADSAKASPLLQDLMADADHSVRITALQWSAGRGENGLDMLVRALGDGDNLTQRAGIQIMIDYGLSDEVIGEVMAAAEAEDERTVRQMLSVFLPQ
jgi:hypothetical protein